MNLTSEHAAHAYPRIIFVQSVAIFLRGGLLQFGILAYACLALGWFTLRSLRQIVLPATDPGNAIANPSGTFHRKRRVYFLFIFVVLQVLSVWWLVK